MRVLVVEDDYMIGSDLCERLRLEGHVVTGPAPSCAAALEAIWTSRPDVALLDTTLGTETCEAVLEECIELEIPVVICSAHGLAQLPEYAAKLPFLAKPFSDADVFAALQKGLAGSGHRDTTELNEDKGRPQTPETLLSAVCSTFATGELSTLYAISYRLILGTTVHRAISAKAAIEALNLIRTGGGTVVRIIVTRTGGEISYAELRQLAADEA